jgi:hypothetical protein
MTLHLKFANGAEIDWPIPEGQPLPAVFQFRTPEGAVFYFYSLGRLYGQELYREIDALEAQKIVRELNGL